MKWRRSLAALTISGVLAFPSAARAADDDEVLHDARTEGYPQKVQVTKASVALVWLAFLFMSVVTDKPSDRLALLGAMMKHRSPID